MPKYVNASASFPKASFQPIGGDKYEFPYERFNWKCDLRHKVHEFLHMAGGKIESQERRIYGVTFDGVFYDSYHSKGYPGLYPGTLSKLVRAFEDGLRGVLVVPSPVIGSINARCVNWEGSFAVKIQSGEAVKLSFIEDNQDAFLFSALVDTSSAPASIASLNEALALQALNVPTMQSLFSAINDAANAVFGVKDDVSLGGAVLESRLEYLTDLCARADIRAEMKDPTYCNVMNALHNLWMAGAQAINDLQAKRSPLMFYLTPHTMSAAEVAGDPRVYGDSSRVNDIVQINPVITDPFRIPAGTRLQYYPDSPGDPFVP